MRILIDMDATLNNWNEHFIRTVEDMDFIFNKNTFTSYNIESNIVGLNTNEQKKLISMIMEDLDWWDRLIPLPYASAVIKELNSKNEVIIATAPWTFERKYAEEKIRWLNKYFRFLSRNQIIFERKKWVLEGDIIIEDKPDALIKCKEAGMITICHNQPYNLDTKCDYRFTDWVEVLNIFNRINRRR